MPVNRLLKRSPGLRRPLHVVAIAGACAVAAGTALAAAAPEPTPRVSALAADGTLELTNSRGGAAVLTTGDLAPGDAATGIVTIGNRGNAAGALQLAQSDVVDTPGPMGGRLSATLELDIDQAAGGGAWSPVYAGPLSGFTSTALGTLDPGTERTYRFTVRLPRSTDNSVQAAGVSVAYGWRATVVGVGAGDPPPPATAPPPAGAPPPTTGPDSTPPRLTLAAGRPQRLRRGSAVITATCDEPCRVVSMARGAAAKPLGEIRAGMPTKLTVKLSTNDAKRLAHRLRGHKKVPVALSVTVADRAGNRTTARTRVVLRR